MKRWIVAIAAAVMCYFLPMWANAAFPDVNYNTEMGRAIQFLHEEQVIQGFPDSTFQPYRLVTRGQAAKMLATLTNAVPMSHEYPLTAQAQFRDVPLHHQYFATVQALTEYAIVSGYPDNTFRVNASITRAHIAKMIANTFVLREAATSIQFTDIARGTERYDYASRVYETGIMPYTTFQPNKTISRGEMALFLFRAHHYAVAEARRGQTLQPFIGTNTTLGQAFQQHPFMQAAVKQRMPIAATRYTIDRPHYYAGYEMPYPCSYFANASFNLCYDGDQGVVLAYMYDYDMQLQVKLRTLKQALGQHAWTTETFTQENGELLHHGYTSQAINGLYYRFVAYGGASASPLYDDSIVTQFSVSVYPTN